MAKVDWKETDGTIVSGYISRGKLPGLGAVFTYKVDGNWYSGTYLPSEPVNEGDLISVRYDPKNPERNDLVEKEKRTKWIVGVLIATVIAIAIVCFIN